MGEYLIPVIEGIPAGKSVYNGFADETCTAPTEPGIYTLYECADLSCNDHCGWHWKQEEPTGKAVATYDQMKVEE